MKQIFPYTFYFFRVLIVHKESYEVCIVPIVTEEVGPDFPKQWCSVTEPAGRKGAIRINNKLLT